MSNKDKLKRYKKEFGAAVRRRRHKLGLSQDDFAVQADIHRTYVSSIVVGTVDVGISVAYKISTALNTPLNILIKEAEKNI